MSRARVSRNVDLIANGGGIGRRCAEAPTFPRFHWRFTSFLYDCTFLRLLFVAQDFEKSPLERRPTAENPSAAGATPESGCRVEKAEEERRGVYLLLMTL